jgi:prepilin-type N-terminal cleavage/methylation domain-containing protein
MRIARNTKGFTLVEIMIVVAIIGLLAAIAVPNFVQARNQARKNTCINNLRLIDASKEQYALENNKDNACTPDSTDLTPYLKNGQWPQCSSATTDTYSASIGAIGVKPQCAFGNGHQLP